MNVDPLRPDPGARPEDGPRRRGRERSVPAAARIPTGPVAEHTHRNPIWLLGGVLLVLASAVGGMVLFRAGDERVEVLVAGRDLAVGEVVDRDDFRIRRVAVDGLEVIGPDDVDGIVGQRARGPVPSGALVHPAMFSDAEPIGPDEMDIGAALDPGAFPRRDLTLGAAVELLVVTDTAEIAATTTVVGDPSSPAVPVPGAVVSVGRGVVVAVEERASGQLLVTVRVERSIGLTASHAAAENNLRLALVEQGSAGG